MKALLINEVQEFKRGIGSRESLDIGIEAQKKNWWKKSRHYSRDLIISSLNRALKDSNSYMDVYPTSSFGVGYPLEIKYRLETPNPPLKSKYITLIINNKGDIFLPGFDGKYLGNFTELVDKKFEKNLRTNLNRIVTNEEILESIDFKRTGNSKKSMGIGKYKPLKIGDKIKILKDLYLPINLSRGAHSWELSDKPNKNYRNAYLYKDDVLIINDKTDSVYGKNVYSSTPLYRTSGNYHIKQSWVHEYDGEYVQRI